jgi:hypothetical protein
MADQALLAERLEAIPLTSEIAISAACRRASQATLLIGSSTRRRWTWVPAW